MRPLLRAVLLSSLFSLCLLTSATGTPALSPSEAPSAANATPPTADTALRHALREELFKAAKHGNLDEVQRLLDAGADPSFVNDRGQTTLMAACYSAEAPIVSLLLRRGAAADAASFSGATALHYAAWRDPSGRVAALLVAAGAQTDRRQTGGWAPLHTAALFSNEAAARALLAAGASKTLTTDDGRTPYDVAESDALRRLLRP